VTSFKVINMSAFSLEEGIFTALSHNAYFYSSSVPFIRYSPHDITYFLPIWMEIFRNKISHLHFLNCCPSVHVDNHTIITPTKCTLLLLKAPDITVYTLCHYILPLHVSTRVGHLQGVQCQCLAKVIINYNLLKLC
jgi:hypothetical protein